MKALGSKNKSSFIFKDVKESNLLDNPFSELYDYIESGKIPDPHNPQDILDDWEMVELDNALDILLPYLRSESESDDQAENEI